MSTYTNILLSNRLRTSAYPGRTILTDSESDRGRVLFCPAFRRLQQKAQVFSMEPNAAVRSRLTHSLEVSQIGRYIADEVGQRLVGQNMLDVIEQGVLVNFVETACLMHDIGNPPFGHFGEAAVQHWFRTNGEACVRAVVATTKLATEDLFHAEMKAALADFDEFDGNPQGLRVVGKLQWNTDEFGLNLTKTTLAAFLKYIRGAGEDRTGPFRKKAGYFSTEEDLVKTLWAQFGYSTGQRFPLTYLMEAADDIAYCVSDLEDSFEKQVVHEASALEEIERRYLACELDENDPTHAAIKEAVVSVRRRERRGKEYTFTDFRTSINRAIVPYVADRYVAHHDDVLAGRLEGLLPKDEPAGAVLEVLKSYCGEHVYTHESIQRIELAGYTAINGMLDHFAPLLRVARERFLAALKYEKKDNLGEPIVIESKLLSLFPEKYIKVYLHHLTQIKDTKSEEFLEWNARAHLVVDFVSGMTDDFAMTTYRTLAGMRL